jgi:hypothetical protein
VQRAPAGNSAVATLTSENQGRVEILNLQDVFSHHAEANFFSPLEVDDEEPETVSELQHVPCTVTEEVECVRKETSKNNSRTQNMAKEKKGEAREETAAKQNFCVEETKETVNLKSAKCWSPFRLVAVLLSMFALLLSCFTRASVNATFEANVAAAEPKGSLRRTVLLDTGCNFSCTNFKGWLGKIFKVFCSMKTANGGESTCNDGGSAVIKGEELRFLHVPEFNKTLIAWTDLAALGMTGTLGRKEIQIFKAGGSPWLTATLEDDGLWHFLDLEAAVDGPLSHQE